MKYFTNFNLHKIIKNMRFLGLNLRNVFNKPIAFKQII